jgi:transcriptional regulator with XRE-family HTH domain
MTILKEYRINNNLGQQEMAKKLECSLPAYRNYEIGKRIIPHNILINFLKIRGKKQDLELATALEEIYEKDVTTR